MSILTLSIIGILCLAVSSLIALVYALKHAEEGYEDSTGYHRQTSNDKTAQAVYEAIRGGSACPWDFKPTLRPFGHDHFSPHQS